MKKPTRPLAPPRQLRAVPPPDLRDATGGVTHEDTWNTVKPKP